MLWLDRNWIQPNIPQVAPYVISFFLTLNCIEREYFTGAKCESKPLALPDLVRWRGVQNDDIMFTTRVTKGKNAMLHKIP